jgi:hypothetical protein
MASLESILKKNYIAPASQPPADSEAELAARLRFQSFFESLTPDRVESDTANVYASNAILHDTLVTHEGVEDIRKYLKRTAERADGVKVAVDEWLRGRDAQYMRWTMDITWSAFKKGQTTRSSGVSLIRFDAEGKVLVHYDFWDSANGFFIHLPVIGWLMKKVIARV